MDPVPPVASVDEVKVTGVAPTQMVWSAEIVPDVSAGFTVTVTLAVLEQDEAETPVTV
jgi:hypothetical protein